MVDVAAVLLTDGEEIVSVPVAVNEVMDHAVRLTPVEEALTGATLDEGVLSEAANLADDGLGELLIMDNIQASAEFRVHLLCACTERR